MHFCICFWCISVSFLILMHHCICPISVVFKFMVHLFVLFVVHLCISSVSGAPFWFHFWCTCFWCTSVSASLLVHFYICPISGALLYLPHFWCTSVFAISCALLLSCFWCTSFVLFLVHFFSCLVFGALHLSCFGCTSSAVLFLVHFFSCLVSGAFLLSCFWCTSSAVLFLVHFSSCLVSGALLSCFWCTSVLFLMHFLLSCFWCTSSAVLFLVHFFCRSCHKYHFCCNKKFCCDKYINAQYGCHDFVTTKICCDKSFVATSILLSQQKTCFVVTNTCLLWHDKTDTCGSSHL